MAATSLAYLLEEILAAMKAKTVFLALRELSFAFYKGD